MVALSQAELLAEIEAQLACVRSELEGLRLIVAQQSGRPTPDVEAFNPLRLAKSFRSGATANAFDFRALLGKPATYSRVNNLGSAMAQIAFYVKNPADSVTITLAPGDILEPKFFWDTVQILEAGEGTVDIEVIAQ